MHMWFSVSCGKLFCKKTLKKTSTPSHRGNEFCICVSVLWDAIERHRQRETLICKSYNCERENSVSLSLVDATTCSATCWKNECNSSNHCKVQSYSFVDSSYFACVCVCMRCMCTTWRSYIFIASKLQVTVARLLLTLPPVLLMPLSACDI